MRAGEPSRTAYGAATHRAVHQVLEGGAVFTDPLAWRILGIDEPARIEEVVEHARQRPDVLRLFIARRHRFAEDRLATAVARGTRQVVVLGAGLDTFAYRNPHPGTVVFEVDHPATGGWKRERLAEARIPVPDNVRYVGCDFETEDVVGRLVEAGFDRDAPAFVVWLGVTPYLTPEAVEVTLRRIASLPGGEVVLDFAAKVPGLSSADAELRRRLEARVAREGEPFRSTYGVAEMRALLESAGFGEIEHVGDPDRPGQLVRARVGTDSVVGC